MPDQPSESDLDLHDPVIATKLGARYRHLRAVGGAEPADLERIARWVDGDLAPDEARVVEARVAADPELGEVVARMRAAEGAGVVSLAAARAQRDAGRKRGLWMAGGGLLAAAAIALVVVSGGGPKPTDGPLGAGAEGARPTVAIANGQVTAHGASLVVVVHPGAAHVVADGEKVAADGCGFVVAVAGDVRAAQATEVLGSALAKSCELPPLEVVKDRIQGATALTVTRL